MPEFRTPRPNRLRKIKLTEVSLVRRGANPLAHVVLTKHAQQPLLFTDALALVSALTPTRR